MSCGSSLNSSSQDKMDETCRTVRDAPPTHFRLKFESFSCLSKCSKKRYESGEFFAGDYKWKLAIYPNGNKKADGKDHISVYLVLVDSFDFKKEILVIFSLFLFDQIQDKYLSLQGRVRRFHAAKTQWGFDKFLPLTTFNDPSNGYLVNDMCVFGVEVFVIQNTIQGECVSMVKKPVSCWHTWKIERFSELKDISYYSSKFKTGDQKWKILLYPKGYGDQVGKSISLFLYLDNPDAFPPCLRVLVDFILRVVDQVTGENFENQGSALFTATKWNWGWNNFLALSDLKSSKNYLLNDALIIQAEVTVCQIAKNWE